MLKQRILTALFLAPLALLGLFGLSGGWFAFFVACVVLLGAWEWARLSGLTDTKQRLIYTGFIALLMWVAWLADWVNQSWLLWLAAVGWLLNAWWVTHYPGSTAQWKSAKVRMAMGVWVLLPCWVGFNQLSQHGNEWLLFVLLLVWGADVGAYFAGRQFGQRKLASNVSPGKSWEGVYGGLVVVSCLSLIYICALPLSVGQSVGLWLVAILVTFVSVLGDLLESMLKRYADLKDSSNLLPGHGGILDRVDSLSAAIPIFALIIPWLS